MTESYLYLLIKAVITLGFVLGLMAVAFYALRYFSGGRSMGRGRRSANPVRVVSTTFLGNKRNLAVVDVAGELILIGITPTRISMLTKVESPEAASKIMGQAKAASRPIFNLFQQ